MTFSEDRLITLRRTAMDYLARREHSFQELLAKLSKRYPDFDRDTRIVPVLETLRRENLQSDERFVESYTRSRMNAGMGPLKIRAELFHKGVDSELVENILHGGDFDWPALARRALLKKYPGGKPQPLEEQRRCYRFLAQRGFKGEDIKAAIGDSPEP